MHMLAPYRSLALRVISVAVHDLVAPAHSPSDRDSARAFLSGSGMLTHWCGLAGIDPEAFQRRVRGFVQKSYLEQQRRNR